MLSQRKWPAPHVLLHDALIASAVALSAEPASGQLLNLKSNYVFEVCAWQCIETARKFSCCSDSNGSTGLYMSRRH